MNYLNYTIKCIIRNIVRLCFKPRNLAIILVALIIIYVLSCNGVFAATPFLYETWNDKCFINLGTEVQVAAYSGLHGFAVYIQPMTKGGVQLNVTTDELHIAVYGGSNAPKSGDKVTDYYYTSYNKDSNYWGFDATTGQYRTTGYWLVWYSVDITASNVPSYYEVIDDSEAGRIDRSIQEQTTEIISAQQETTEAIQDLNDTMYLQTVAIEDQTDFLTDSDIDDESMEIDTSSLTFTDTNNLNNFFSNFLNSIKNVYDNLDNTVETVEIPLPYTTQKLVLSSDLLSKHIVNTPIYNMIQVFWWFIIGSYLIVYCRRIATWLSSGELAEKGPAAFIRYLDKNNELIKTYMM